MNDFYIQQQSEPDVKTKRYKSFEGVNLTSDYWSVSDLNSPYMVNMIKDYERGGTLKTRPRIKKYMENVGPADLFSFDAKLYCVSVRGLFYDLSGTAPVPVYLNNYEQTYPFRSGVLRRKSVIYKNVMYFYEQNRAGDPDIFIFDKEILTRFSDIITSYSGGFESDGFVYDFPLPDGYTYADYTIKDQMRVLEIIKGEGGAPTDAEKIKYDINKDSSVTVSDAMLIMQIVAGKINDKSYVFTSADITAVENIISSGETPTESELQKYDVNNDGQITSDDLTVIKDYVKSKQVSIKDLPLEIAPVTYINANKYGAGDPYERINLMSPYFSVQFLGDGESTEFSLPLLTAMPLKWESEEDEFFKSLNGTQTAGKVKLDNAPADGEKFYVLCKMAGSEYDLNRRIAGSMEIPQIYDNRVFLAGAENEYKNRIIHSGIDNPLYFPDNAYYEEAQGSGKITALLPVKGQLAVIKEDSDGKNAVYLHTPQDTENDLAPRIYPSTYGIVDNGCINPECYTVFGGEALYLSRNGLMSVSSTDLSDERSIEFRSSNVFSDKKVNKDAFMWKDDDFLYIQNGKDDPTVYIADKRNRTYNKNTLSQEFEWFVWDGIYISDTDKNYPVLSCAESDGKVYFNFWDPDSSTGAIGAEDAGCVYMLTYDRDDSGKYEDEAGYISVSEVTLKKTVRPLPVYSVFSTPLYDYGSPHIYKNCVRRGCVAGMSAETEVYMNTSPVFAEVYLKRTSAGGVVDEAEWSLPDGYKKVITAVQRGNNLIFRPSLKRWLYISYVFYSPGEPVTLYDITARAQLRAEVNDIYGG